MKDVTIGACASAELTVNDQNLAVNVGSGSLEVFATPEMVMLMEKAACKCMEQFIDDGETTVGTEMNVKHIAATPKGMTVTANACVTEVNGREIVFKVTASDQSGAIGEGIHKRFLVNSEKFTAKTYSKLG
ncbi:MAG: thioesterase family protein [Ruminococcus sp.]|jgi:predicted thioesterase|nr:thioesterase family protein [Ruminococcus sp.]